MQVFICSSVHLFIKHSQSTMSKQKLIEGFHPEKSRVNSAALADFIRSPITGDLGQVPGIGPATIVRLKAAGVDTTFALIGKYLTLKTGGVESVEHQDRFYFWLTSLDTVSGYRAGICQAIAEKVNTFMPGIYDGDVYCCCCN